MSDVMRPGNRCLTKGGWLAVVCTEETVFHEVNGGKLYTHDEYGNVKSSTVGANFDLEYELTPIRKEF